MQNIKLTGCILDIATDSSNDVWLIGGRVTSTLPPTNTGLVAPTSNPHLINNTATAISTTATTTATAIAAIFASSQEKQQASRHSLLLQTPSLDYPSSLHSMPAPPSSLEHSHSGYDGNVGGHVNSSA